MQNWGGRGVGVGSGAGEESWSLESVEGSVPAISSANLLLREAEGSHPHFCDLQ